MSAKHNTGAVFLEVFFLLQCSNKFVPFPHHFFTDGLLTSLLLLIAFLINKVNGKRLNLKLSASDIFYKFQTSLATKLEMILATLDGQPVRDLLVMTRGFRPSHQRREGGMELLWRLLGIIRYLKVSTNSRKRSRFRSLICPFLLVWLQTLMAARIQFLFWQTNSFGEFIRD